MSPAAQLANMKEVRKVLDARLLPALRLSGWEGDSVERLHQRRDGLDIWATLFGWPKGRGPNMALSIDVGVVPQLVGWEVKRDEALRLLCNGWDPKGLTYNVPTCWQQRFPEQPITYSGLTPEKLATLLETSFAAIERWARERSADELRVAADDYASRKGPENAGARKWARNYLKVLG